MTRSRAKRARSLRTAARYGGARSAREAAFLAAVAAGGASAVFALDHGVRSGRLRPWDEATLRWFRRHRLPPAVATAGELIGKAAVDVPLGLALGLWAGQRRGWRAGLPIALAAPLAFAAQRAGKRWFGRRRPPRAIREGKTGPCFPSGHAATPTALGLTTAYVAYREGLLPPGVTVPATVAATVLAVASKLDAERHWLSDIFAGGAAGLAVAAACAAGREAARAPRPRRVKQ